MRAFLLALSASLCLPVLAWAEPSPCKYGEVTAEATTVDIGAIYKAADAVVVGKVTDRNKDGSDLVFSVDKVLKGVVGNGQAILHGQQRINTEMNGFVLPGNRDVLLFLKANPTGVFDNVEEYNSACNIVTYVKDGKAVFVEHDEHNTGTEVTVDKVEKYLEISPPKLVFQTPISFKDHEPSPDP